MCYTYIQSVWPAVKEEPRIPSGDIEVDLDGDDSLAENDVTEASLAVKSEPDIQGNLRRPADAAGNTVAHAGGRKRRCRSPPHPSYLLHAGLTHGRACSDPLQSKQQSSAGRLTSSGANSPAMDPATVSNFKPGSIDHATCMRTPLLPCRRILGNNASLAQRAAQPLVYGPVRPAGKPASGPAADLAHSDSAPAAIASPPAADSRSQAQSCLTGSAAPAGRSTSRSVPHAVTGRSRGGAELAAPSRTSAAAVHASGPAFDVRHGQGHDPPGELDLADVDVSEQQRVLSHIQAVCQDAGCRVQACGHKADLSAQPVPGWAKTKLCLTSDCAGLSGSAPNGLWPPDRFESVQQTDCTTSGEMGVRVSAVRVPSSARMTGMQDPVMRLVLYAVCGVTRNMCGGRI